MTAAAVTVSHAALRYGPITALDQVSLSVTEGQKVALVGPSGAGKSSLLDVISRRVVLTTGNVRVFDQDVTALTGRAERALRGRVGIVAQGLDLALPLRVIHNVNAGRLGRWSTARAAWSLVRPSTDHAVRGALAQVGLAHRILARTDELSGGERQRVAIARVMLQDPELVLADEPTASVDPKLADEMMALLCRGGRTLIVSAHDPHLARRHVDRVVGMRNGQIVLDEASSNVTDTQLADFYDE